MNVVELHCTVNGRPVRDTVLVRLTAAEFLRDRLGLRGTKVSCEMQVCGACTILVDGEPVSSCCMLAADLDGRRVETIEGLARGGELHPLQAAFWEHNAFQCGFCTPGFLMMSKALLDAEPDPGPELVREWLDGNICRCTGYRSIEQAVLSVATTRDGDGRPG